MGSIDPQSQSQPFDVKNIAIIGAGPCGLSAAKYLLVQESFDSIVIYEQNPEVGGVWFYSPQPSTTLRVPQTSAFAPPSPPLRSQPPVFPSPMYELLNTNIPWTLMKYGDKPFPEDSVIFPPRQAVQDYLVDYAQEIRHLIKFSTTVKDVKLHRHPSGKDQWTIETQNLLDPSSYSSFATFDAVVVASGHYALPYIPSVPNIATFHDTHPSIISHAKSYRSPVPFTSQRVLVVGNAASGLDIASQISHHATPPLFLSAHEPTPDDQLARIPGCVQVPAIAEYLPHQCGVRFADGRVETNLDAIVYCTGYFFTFPFFNNAAATLTPPGLVTEDGRRVYGLYKHLFHIDHPTLVFPGLPIRVVPFPVSEAQAAVFARVWANQLLLPSKLEMAQWEANEAEAARERGSGFHVFPKGGDAAYLDEFHAWAVRAEAGSGQKKGKEPPVWSAEQKWQRASYVEAKLKFEMTGRTAKSLAELGFVYTPPSEVEEPQDIV
ncbi:hypothetical protein BD289DRAFT_427744 [Coniella lustricola]|uniref:Thiol-specific monooxygenase n=1 Tax=Coniella lustricola TaxID=2025994 RepID=A0A2T3AF44_9PEZI|nr:hypothetical protein BD289DRAFT_427744 [Coniella lustricola]